MSQSNNNNTNNTNNNNNIFELISECSVLSSFSDDIYNSIEEITKENIKSIDINSAEQQLNLALDNYNKSITLLNNIVKDENNKNNYLEYKSQIENSLYLTNLKRKKTIELKGRILASHSLNSKVILTLSQCIVYRWQEDTTTIINNNNNNNNNNYGSPKINSEVIEKEILGQGKFHLTKLNKENESELHSIRISFDGNGENSNDNEIKEQLFIVTPETGILVYQRGHYVLQVDNLFYGLILPENIPPPYIDLLERFLVSISYFVALPPPTQEQQQNTISLTETTSTTIISDPNDPSKKQVSFVISSFQSASSGVDSGSQTIVNGILTASAMISVGLRGGGFLLKSNLDKSEEPTTVSPFVVKSVDFIKGVTPYAKQGSTFLIDSFSSVVSGVGNGIVSGVKYFIPKNQDGEKENETFNAAVDFGKQSFKSISSIVGAFGDGISQIYDEATGTTVDVLNHKYGEHVANVTDKTFSASKDLFDTAMNIRGLGLKVAKQGTKEIVETSFIKQSPNGNIEMENQLITLEKDSNNNIISLEKITDKEIIENYYDNNNYNKIIEENQETQETQENQESEENDNEENEDEEIINVKI